MIVSAVITTVIFGIEVEPTVSMGALIQIGFTVASMLFGFVGGYYALKYLVTRLVERVSALERVTEHIGTLITDRAVNDRRFMNIEDAIKDFRAYIMRDRKLDGYYDRSEK